MSGLFVFTLPVTVREGQSTRVFTSNIERNKIFLQVTQGYLVDWDAQKAVWDGTFSDVFGVGLSPPHGSEFRI